MAGEIWRASATRLGAISIVAVACMQAILFDQAYGFSHLMGSELPWYVDHLYHLYQIHVNAALWGQGALTGLDPQFAAGYLGGVTVNWSAKAPTILVWLASGAVTPEFGYKLYIAAAVLSAPLFVCAAARLLGGGAKEILIAGGMGILLWWASYLSWYVTVGMVSYVWGAFFALYVGTAVWDACSRELRVARVLLVSLAAAAGWWLHPHFPLLVALVLVPLLACYYRELPWGRVFAVCMIVGASALLLNYPWLAAMFGTGKGDVDTLTAFGGFQRAVAPLRIVREALGEFGGGAAGAKVNPAFLLLTGVAIAVVDARRRRIAVGLLASWLAAQILAYCGASIEAVARIQPNRIAPASYLLLAVPATWGLTAIVESARYSRGSAWRGVLAVAAAAALLAYPIVETVKEAFPGEHGRYGMPPPQFRNPTPLVDWLVGTIRTQLKPGRRVLLEQSAARVFDHAHMAGLLALLTKAEFIGGPYASNDRTNFKDGQVLGHDIEDLSDAALAEMLDRYAVGLIIVHSEKARRRLAGFPRATALGSLGPAHAFRLESSVDVFLRGHGRVAESQPGRLRLEGLVGKEVVLKYHFLSALRAIPEARIEPYELGHGETPFIRLVDPPERLVLTTARR